MQKDNSTYAKKVYDRQQAIRLLNTDPVICETHGGYGKLFQRCYVGIRSGVVFETDEKKAMVLARQRPSWSIWNEDSTAAIVNGVGAHLVVNLLDVDPYGQPWDLFDAWFGSDRPRATKLVVVCNDGLRQSLRIGGAWNVKQMSGMVRKYGNRLHDFYLEIAKEVLTEKAAIAGYSMCRFSGYYCGPGQQMTHYTAEMTRS